jgi:MoaA/NifB/PqqE/SkfB family radical SAM enzyme
MLNTHEIKVLHIEPTDVCQAACPLCARETNVFFDKEKHHHLSMEQILSIVSINQIGSLNKMFMCGNYGDPAAGKYTLDIFNQFRTINPSITLGMNTNGAIQSKQWWNNLATVFNQHNDYVVFSIDGLSDTNHIYRKNVSWDKLIENATSFISAGGSAHWDMLIYRHNEHQVDQCRQLAKDLGFKWFRAKVSKRPETNEIKLPINWRLPVVDLSKINCHAVNEQSIYIDATGSLRPCCWFGINKEKNIRSISDVSSTWNTPSPHPVCKQSCSTSKSGNTIYQNQFRIEEQLC